MRIRFCGGAQTVTGSLYLLSVNGKNILLECGLFQGRRRDTYERNKNFPFDVSKVDAVLLSHAHIDHSGNIPSLVKNGYDGPIFATHATVELCQIMLRDSAFLQEKDVEWINKIRRRKNQPLAETLYSTEDVEKALTSFEGINYDESFGLFPDITLTFRDAGHILGSAGILLEIIENGRSFRLGFSGDIGRASMPIIRDPNLLLDLDVLIMESTYGNRHHGPSEDTEEELAQVVREVAKAGGKIIIPAFAVGRTQLVVYMLHKLFDQNRIPDIPIFVDSPMASSATEVFRSHPECFDGETYRLFTRDNRDPFGFYRLKYIRDVEESKALNGLTFPHIIISASGMAEGGRILHHLRNNIENHRNLILMVGYAASHTLARKLMDGEKVVRIFGNEHHVRCKVKTMDDFSAHADRNDLIEYAKNTPPSKLQKIFLVHGDSDQALPLSEALKNDGFTVEFPVTNQVYRL